MVWFCFWRYCWKRLHMVYIQYIQYILHNWVPSTPVPAYTVITTMSHKYISSTLLWRVSHPQFMPLQYVLLALLSSSAVLKCVDACSNFRSTLLWIYLFKQLLVQNTTEIANTAFLLFFTLASPLIANFC
jgi:hypothetical protein